MSTIRSRWRRRLKHRQHRLHQARAHVRAWRAAVAWAKRVLARHPAQRTHHDWMAGARRLERQGTAWQIDCASKGVLHTTEGTGDATPTLDAKRAWPHFQVETTGQITQYLPMSTGARALVHDGVPTNGAHAFQIEVCGHAAQPDWPQAQIDAVKRVMRFIEHNGGVARQCHVKFVTGGGQRLSQQAWLALTGWCGHQHVPENDHVDPGPINIEELLT